MLAVSYTSSFSVPTLLLPSIPVQLFIYLLQKMVHMLQFKPLEVGCQEGRETEVAVMEKCVIRWTICVVEFSLFSAHA